MSVEARLKKKNTTNRLQRFECFQVLLEVSVEQLGMESRFAYGRQLQFQLLQVLRLGRACEVPSEYLK